MRKYPCFQNSILDCILHEKWTITQKAWDKPLSRVMWLLQEGSFDSGEVPRFLRAAQKIKGSKKKVYHFVEWHSGDAKMLMSPQSFTQLCVYEDLGEVGYFCRWFSWTGTRFQGRSEAYSRILANRNRYSMDFRQMANSVASRCGTGCRHPHCRFA